MKKILLLVLIFSVIENTHAQNSADELRKKLALTPEKFSVFQDSLRRIDQAIKSTLDNEDLVKRERLGAVAELLTLRKTFLARHLSEDQLKVFKAFLSENSTPAIKGKTHYKQVRESRSRLEKRHRDN